MIQNYGDFIAALLQAGFSGAAGGKDDGVFALFRYSEGEGSLRWHTGDPETDPWEWRMRVLDERDDIAYAKVFSRKAGYIMREWYPYFLAARRGGRTAEQEYADGKLSSFARRAYAVVAEHDALPLHEVKRLAGVLREEKGLFDAALIELQMKLYITLCGRQQKRSQSGGEYGWASTVLCTTEQFWGEAVFEAAAKLTATEAEAVIKGRVLELNSQAQERAIKKFIH